MKFCLLFCSAGLFIAAPASAAIYSATWSSGFANGGAVPDGNPAGWSDSRTLPVPGSEMITDVDVRISMGGGWNGDLYAYLAHSSNPAAAILLNRPGRTAGNGFGFSDSVLTITLDDAAANGDSHSYQSAAGYAAAIGNNSPFQPDGRAVSPLTVDGTEARTAMLSLFNGMSSPSGQWTLFVADLSGGDVTTVNSWGLNITTAIPEPGAVLLSLLGGSMMVMRRRRSA